MRSRAALLVRALRARSRRAPAGGVVAVLAALSLGACAPGDGAGERPPPPPETVVYALGDGADGGRAARALADYVKRQPMDRFLYLGDVYETGTAAEFDRRYEPLYGSLASKTDPVIGNHEYADRHRGYYPYWRRKRGWPEEQAKHRAYVDRTGWQLIAYSSETDMASEAKWVAAQVARHPGSCRIVIAHKGRHVVADTEHGDNRDQDGVWKAIASRTAINLVAHNHLYGRLEPIDGTTVVVSGAGGHNMRALGRQHHRVATSRTRVPLVTRLVLRRGAAELQQLDARGRVHDAGAVRCTPAP